MFERFTRDARDVVVRAQLQARRLGHPGIGTAHLLLAVIEGGPAATLLIERGVTQAAVERVLAEILATPAARRGLPADTTGAAGQAGSPSPQEQRAQDAAALAALGIDLDRIRDAVEAAFGPGALDPPRRAAGRRPRRTQDELVLLRGRRARSGHLPFGDDAKKALELSLREAIRLEDGYIGVEHLLLGLLRPADTVAAGILARLGVDRAQLRHVVEQQGRRRSA